MSELSPAERGVVEGATELMKRYVSAYVHSDKQAFSGCFHPEVSMAVGAQFLSSARLRKERADSDHYFDVRRGHWTPPVRTTIGVKPINLVAALGRVRWMYPATSTGLEYFNVSMYMCVRTDEGWKILMVTTPSEAGAELCDPHVCHQEWDVPRWPIFREA